MSESGLFVVGVAVTLILGVAMALLIYGAILDGRYAARQKAAGASHSTIGLNLLEAVRAAGGFQTLIAAVDRAGLSDVLADSGPYTLFAPEDEAFARLPAGAVESLLAAPETLTDVVNYHLVPGRLTAADVAHRISAETLQGEDLVISNNGVIRIDGAHVLSGDIEACNGVIHVIDRVLLPARI